MKATEQIYITEEDHALLKVEAAKVSMTMGELVHVLLANWIMSREK